MNARPTTTRAIIASKVNPAITKAAIAIPKLVSLLLLEEEEEEEEEVLADNVLATLASEYGNGMLGFTTKFAITWKLGEPKPNARKL